jgi:hypothetical protein
MSEADMLKKRIQALEDRLTQRADDQVFQSVLARVSGVEEEMERSREEFSQEIKRAYSSSTPLWSSYQQVQKKVQEQDDQLHQLSTGLAEANAALKRLDDRQLELQDADISLEERIENIVESMEEDNYHPMLPKGKRTVTRRRSTSDSRRPVLPFGSDVLDPFVPLRVATGTPASQPSEAGEAQVQHPDAASESTAPQFPTTGMPFRAGSESATTGLWTVHISLMPHTTVPMPFERNTNAYQRCLSRGLHQVVPVRGPTADAFVAAVNKAFGDLLKGRPWMPLEARLCDAEQLQGLPMLRQLDPNLVESSYTSEFLRTNCAVCDANGVMDSLYITMREPHVLSWHALRQSPVVVDGLEDSWKFDPLLDNDGDTSNEDTNRPAAGHLMSSLKRPASEMAESTASTSSLASSSSSSDSVRPRTKRACPPTRNAMLDTRRAGLGTA